MELVNILIAYLMVMLVLQIIWVKLYKDERIVNC